MEDQSVTHWLRQLAKGDQAAACRLWERYGPTLVQIAKRRFRGAFGAAGDEEDLVQSVFRALWVGASQGRFDSVRNRDELWWLLLSIARRKAMSRQVYNSRQKRGQTTVSFDCAPEFDSSKAEIIPADSDQPPPELILILDEQQERLLTLLRDDVLRTIAIWKLEGYTHDEIATKLEVTPRTVVRKLNLIRERWAQELDA